MGYINRSGTGTGTRAGRYLSVGYQTSPPIQVRLLRALIKSPSAKYLPRVVGEERYMKRNE